MSDRPQFPVPKKLQALREQVLRIAHLAEAILDKALRSVWERNAVLAREVAADDLPIDRLDVEIDRSVLEFLALQAPVAQELRQVIAIKTATTDLERVGDLARNIAKSAMRLSERPPISPSPLLRTLASESQRQLKNAICSFADYDSAAARKVLAEDDRIDADEDQAIRAAIEEIQDNPQTSEQEIDFIFIAKNLERVGDHATNIAEDVILVVESLNLKHAEKLAS
ncbi:MAG: phosphate signaling complex protein PhoU [Deltaproteobacteria bacterium]|nr:phosphate signaling complex protein PhoU [Deltaproteobacteria bacterium]